MPPWLAVWVALRRRALCWACWARSALARSSCVFFFFKGKGGIRDDLVTGVQTCALPISCHVYVDEAWRAVVGEPSPMEEDMLDFGYEVKPSSRLSCQIKVTAEIDGLVVRVPERQEIGRASCRERV